MRVLSARNHLLDLVRGFEGGQYPFSRRAAERAIFQAGRMANLAGRLRADIHEEVFDIKAFKYEENVSPSKVATDLSSCRKRLRRMLRSLEKSGLQDPAEFMEPLPIPEKMVDFD